MEDDIVFFQNIPQHYYGSYVSVTVHHKELTDSQKEELRILLSDALNSFSRQHLTASVRLRAGDNFILSRTGTEKKPKTKCTH